jgi:FkbM family methyltransferase
MTVYEPGQVAAIYPHLDFEPKWLLLGGPADASEAQDFHERFPNAQILGCEPNPLFRDLQESRGFPGRLLSCALWDSRGEAEMRLVAEGDMDQAHRCASLVAFGDRGDARVVRVETRTLDDLDAEFGPFSDAVLWIDVEEAELACLRGATRLLGRGAIRLVNLEVYDFRLPEVTRLLGRFGLHDVGRWNANVRVNDDGSRTEWWNVIFRLG